MFPRTPKARGHNAQEASHATTSKAQPPLAVKERPIRIAYNNLTQRNWFHSLPFPRFHALLTLFPKSFSSFPHGTCLLSVSSLYLALEENYLPFCAPLPKYATLRKQAVRSELQATDGILTLSDAFFQRNLHLRHLWHCTFRLQFAPEGDLQIELFPVHSPLLRESYSFSFPGLTYMLKLSP